MTALLVVLGVVVVVAAVIVRDQFRHPEAWGPPHDHTDTPPVVVIVAGAPPRIAQEPRYGVSGGVTPERPLGRGERILVDGGVLEGEVVEQVPAVPNPRTAGRLPASTRRPSLDRG